MKTRKKIKRESQPLNLLDRILKQHKGVVPKVTLQKLQTDEKV